MYKQLILLLGMLLCSYVLAAAQTVAPRIVLASHRIAPIAATVRTASAPLLAGALLRPRNPGKSTTHFSYLSARAYQRDRTLEGLENLSQVREVKTLFSTQSSLPLVHFWGGRLRFDGFTRTLDMQNVQLGPSAAGGLLDFRPRRQSYPGEPHSVDLYGLSLSFHLGRNAQIGRPSQIWQNLTRIVSAVR
ncbi:MAG: hypothetical protein WBE86_08605 [Candidatus Acidiferrales bacterium]